MAENGFSLADVLAMSNNNHGDNFLQGNGILIILFFLIFGGFGGGFGGFGGWGNNANAQGALTRAEMFDGFNNQEAQRKLDGIANGICDSTYAINNSINSLGTVVNNGFNGIQRDLCTGFNTVNAGISENRFASQKCCCETNRNIDSVRYENAQNTCAITTNATSNTQKILDKLCQMENNAKDQRIADLTANLQAANFQLSQQAQNATLIRELRPMPVPSYPVSNPYVDSRYYNNCCGCGYNNGCNCRYNNLA